MPNPIVESKIAELDKHLSESAPSMDKFEKAAALNHFRQALTSALKEQRRELVERLQKTQDCIEGQQCDYCRNISTAIALIEQQDEKEN